MCILVDQQAIIAEAFRDDDVVQDFVADKEAVEEEERPKDLDLTLQGWGTWTGPGVTPTKDDRFLSCL